MRNNVCPFCGSQLVIKPKAYREQRIYKCGCSYHNELDYSRPKECFLLSSRKLCSQDEQDVNKGG